MRDGLAGFIDDTGVLVVEPKYFRAGDYHEGLAMVCDGRRCGYLDDDFHEGLAATALPALRTSRD